MEQRRRAGDAAGQAGGKDPLDYVFDLPLDTQLVAKLYQNSDSGVAPLLKHPAGVVALSDAGAHLIYFCDAGFGLHFLQHWVRETRTFTLEEGVRRLTSDPARKYRIPNRGTIAPGQWADLVLVRPRKGGHLGTGKESRPAGRRHPHAAPAARRARRLGKRTTGVRRREICRATVRTGPRA